MVKVSPNVEIFTVGVIWYIGIWQ